MSVNDYGIIFKVVVQSNFLGWSDFDVFSVRAMSHSATHTMLQQRNYLLEEIFVWNKTA